MSYSLIQILVRNLTSAGFKAEDSINDAYTYSDWPVIINLSYNKGDSIRPEIASANDGSAYIVGRDNFEGRSKVFFSVLTWLSYDLPALDSINRLLQTLNGITLTRLSEP